VLLNPVRARLARKPEQWPWSSARAYLKGIDDGLTDTGPMLSRFPDMRALLRAEADEESQRRLRAAETIGRPIGNAGFLKRIEKQSGRNLAPQKRGPKQAEN
jgi:putative transposase